MGRRGRKRLLNVEGEYWKPILAGVGPIEAARQIGIARTTGFRWGAERGGVARLRMLETDRHTRYLSGIEDERLAVLRREGLSMREISRRPGRSPSTISRELRRNMRRHDRGKYDAVLAHPPIPRESATTSRWGDRQGSGAARSCAGETHRGLESGADQFLAARNPPTEECHETIYQAAYGPGTAV
jgi:IS30 family transposase